MTDQGPSEKLRVLVVEDEYPARNYLVELLEASGQAEVVGAVSTREEAELALSDDRTQVDVVFVDVELAHSTDQAGLEIVREFSSRPGAPTFVLATASSEHAIAAFDLGVVDYLVKPFTEERVESCLGRVKTSRGARVQSATRPAPRIVARKGKGLVFLHRDEVWAFEAAGRLTFVHTPHGRYDLDLSLSAIEASLGRSLTRVHRNWLVAGAHVKELVRDGGETRIFVGARVGSDGAGVWAPVARERSAQVRDALLENATGLRRMP
jgi:DNA-binding LytR/AlgR family response regulator